MFWPLIQGRLGTTNLSDPMQQGLNVMHFLSRILFILLIIPPICFGKMIYQTRYFLNISDLPNFQYEENLKGGSGGVDVYKFQEKKYTLKGSRETDHINEEIMTDGLYKSLGVPVPSFAVLDSLDGLPNFHFSQEKWPKGPYRIAFLMIRRPPRPEQIEEVNAFFVADALLANRDIKAGVERNVIIRDGVAYRIDNGGGLRVRSIGGRKGEENDAWDPSLIPELKTLLDHGTMVYQRVNDGDVREQMEAILTRVPQVLQTFQKISRALRLSEQSHIELEHMLIGRLRTLTVLAHPENTYVASRYRYTSPFTAAGAFLLSKEGGKLYMLLGQRNSSKPDVHGTWCTLGGKADYGIDLDLATAASREIYEESSSWINIPDTDMRESPSHDLIRSDHLFRQYVLTIPYVDLSGIHYHEYLDFKWIPVENLLSRKTLETGTIEGTSMRLFEPFWDILKTEQIQYLLKKYMTNRTQLRGLHTQSTLQKLGFFVHKKVEPFPPTLSSAQFEREQQLGRSVVNKEIVLRDIKKGGVKNRPEEVRYAFNNETSSLNRYTASEAHMSQIIEKYVPVTASNTVRALRKNIIAALEKSSSTTNNRFFNAQLLNVLLKERTYDPRFLVLYHACNGETAFLFDILTQLRQLISGQSHQDTQVLRGLDDAFKDVDNIFTFQRKFGIHPEEKKSTTFWSDHVQGKGLKVGQREFADYAISANFFLFGSSYFTGESTVCYFYRGSSHEPLDIRKFLSYLEGMLGGLKLDPDRYIRLYESVIKEKPELNNRLYQIFIHPDYINTLVYGSFALGVPYHFDYERLRNLVSDEYPLADFSDISRSVTHSCTPHKAPPKISLSKRSTAPKGFFEVLKANPELFNRAVQDARRHEDMGATGISSLQARLLLNPHCFHNPDIVRTFMYHGRENAQVNHENFLIKLREYLRDDLAAWLQKKEQLEPEVSVHSGSPSDLPVRYAGVYKANFGKNYTTNEAPLNKILERINASKDLSLLKDLMKKRGLQVLVTPIVSVNSYRQGYSRKDVDRTALLYQDWVLRYIENFLNDPSQASIEKEKLEKFLDTPPQREIYLGILLEELSISQNTHRLDELIKKYGFQDVCLRKVANLKSGYESVLLEENWVYTHLEKIMNTPSPEGLPTREHLAPILIEPILSEINQLKNWEGFKDIEIPRYLLLMNLRIVAKETFVSLFEKRLFDRSLSAEDILDILKHLIFTSSSVRRFFELDPSYPPGRFFMSKLIRHFLEKKTISFEEKKRFLMAVHDRIPSPLKPDLINVTYNSILESSLSYDEKKEYEPWEKLYAEAPKKEDFVESVYGLSCELGDILKKYRLIQTSAPLWGPYSNDVTAYAIEQCFLRFSHLKYYEETRQQQDDNKPSLTVKEIDQLTRFCEALLPLIKDHYDPKLPPYRNLSVANIRKRFIPNSLKEFKDNSALINALNHIQELISFIK